MRLHLVVLGVCATTCSSFAPLRVAPRSPAFAPLRVAPRSPARVAQRRTLRSVPRASTADALIAAGVSIATFAPQPFWLLMCAYPDSEVTKKAMGSLIPVYALGAVHLGVVALAATDNFPEGAKPVLIFAEVFNPLLDQLDGMVKLFEVRNFVAEEWPHVLIWDLFVGRLIWLDGLERNVTTWHSLLLANFIGPPGLLLHAATSVLSGKGLPKLELRS